MKTLAIILTLISMYILSGCSLPPSTPFRASQSPSLKSRQQWVTMHSSINPIYKQAILEGALIARKGVEGGRLHPLKIYLIMLVPCNTYLMLLYVTQIA